jgi:hypothetical protein
MKKQTAVEWLHEIAKQREPDKFDWQQAKEMEKEQIMDAYIMGSYDMAAKEFKPEQYYNEIYNK